MLFSFCIDYIRFYSLGLFRYAIFNYSKNNISLFYLYFMQQIKDFLNFLDFTFATVWGYTVIEIMPHFSTSYIFSSLDNIIKSLFAFVGLIYAMVRCFFYYKRGIRENAKAILEEQRMSQEIENLKMTNFYDKIKNGQYLKEK